MYNLLHHSPDNEEHQVKIINGNGCFSYVGMQPDSGQELSIGDGCESVSILESFSLSLVNFFALNRIEELL